MNTLKCQSKCIGFIPNIKMPLLKEHMIGQVKKLMKMENYSIDIDSKTLALALGFLDLTDDEDTTLLVSILTRAIDFSKWKITEVCLSRMHNAKGLVLLQNNYQKLCQLIVRLAMICPYFLLTLTFQLIVKLLLADRRNLELFIMLKEQLLAAKSWTLRRNYMLLYFEIKCTASFEFNRGVTMYAYKRIVGEKSPHFKL